MVSLDIRKPMDVMGGVLSQLPEHAAFDAKIRAISIWDVQLAKRMLKDCSVIFLSKIFCFPQTSSGGGDEPEMTFHLSNTLFRVKSGSSVCNLSSTWTMIMARSSFVPAAEAKEADGASEEELQKPSPSDLTGREA